MGKKDFQFESVGRLRITCGENPDPQAGDSPIEVNLIPGYSIPIGLCISQNGGRNDFSRFARLARYRSYRWYAGTGIVRLFGWWLLYVDRCWVDRRFFGDLDLPIIGPARTFIDIRPR